MSACIYKYRSFNTFPKTSQWSYTDDDLVFGASALTACGLWFNTLWQWFQCGPHSTRAAKLYSYSPTLIAQALVKPQGCVTSAALIRGLSTWHNDAYTVTWFKAFHWPQRSRCSLSEIWLVVKGEGDTSALAFVPVWSLERGGNQRLRLCGRATINRNLRERFHMGHKIWNGVWRPHLECNSWEPCLQWVEQFVKSWHNKWKLVERCQCTASLCFSSTSPVLLMFGAVSLFSSPCVCVSFCVVACLSTNQCVYSSIQLWSYRSSKYLNDVVHSRKRRTY